MPINAVHISRNIRIFLMIYVSFPFAMMNFHFSATNSVRIDIYLISIDFRDKDLKKYWICSFGSNLSIYHSENENQCFFKDFLNIRLLVFINKIYDPNKQENIFTFID